MRVIAKNFLSFAELDREIGPGVTLVRGYNFDDGTEEGAGKSAILNAISWGLYGEIPKEANVDHVVKQGTKGCEVRVILPEFTVFRSRNPNDVRIEEGKKIFRGKDARETQKEILKRVGMSFATFCQVIYHAQDYPKIFVTENQEGKGKIFSELLDLEQFERARKEAAERMKPLKDELIKVESELQLANAEVEFQDSNIAKFEHLITEFEQEKLGKIQKLLQDHESLVKESDTFLAEFNAHKVQKIRDCSEKLADTKTTLKKLRSEMGEAREALKDQLQNNNKEEIAALEDKLEAITAIREDAKVKLGSIELANKSQKRLENEQDTKQEKREKLKKSLKEKFNFIVHAEKDLEENKMILAAALAAQDCSLPNRNCPTCGQPWTGDPKHLEKEVTKARSQVEKTEGILKVWREDCVKFDQEIDTLTEEIDDIAKELKEFKPLSTGKLEKIIEQTREDSGVIKSAIEDLRKQEEDLEKAKNRVKLIVDQIEVRLSTESEFELKMQELTALSPDSTMEKFARKQRALEKELEVEDFKEPTTLQKNVKSAKELHAQAVKNAERSEARVGELRTKLVRLEALREGYREVKAYTFENTLRQLNSKANMYLTKLFNQQVKIRFRNEDLKIETTVEIDGLERPLGLYSGGQFRRIALAVDLALADITLSRKGNKINLMILDEYFKNLSATSMGRILKILQARKTPTLLIEHNDVFKQIVGQTISVELRGGTSQIVN